MGTLQISFFLGALRPRRRDGLLGTGTEWEEDDRVKARPRKPPEKDRRDRGPPPEQWRSTLRVEAEYLACPHCKGLYQIKLLSKHERRCHQRPDP